MTEFQKKKVQALGHELDKCLSSSGIGFLKIILLSSCGGIEALHFANSKVVRYFFYTLSLYLCRYRLDYFVGILSYILHLNCSKVFSS
jgi:hypothetical protein